jgi:hypothetical protein
MAVVLPWNRDNWKRQLLSLSPFAILAIAYVAPIFAAEDTHQHLNDGTFSLSAPFWIVIPRSIWRMMWIWGLPGVLVLAGWKHHLRSRLLWIAFAWMVIGLLPYSFLLYMPYVPSRHTYLASVGLAILVGAAWVAARERFLTKQWAAAALATLIIAHNCGYLWARKLDQFARRAEPTERLIGFASRITEPGPVYLSCYPFPFETAVQAVKLRVGTHLSPVPTSPGQPVPPGRHLNYCVDGKEPKI